MPDIILTTDRTLMSNYRGKEIFGFSTSSPKNPIPEFLFKFLFFPKIKTKNGIPIEAPYGLRKIEAKLIEEGLEVLTVAPSHLKKYLKDAKVLGINVMDPFGIGPSSITWRKILNTGEPYVEKYFKELFFKKEVREAKKRGLKIIVGGPGAWQFELRKNAIDDYGIDCVVSGEGEIACQKIFKMAMNDEDLPKFYEVNKNEVPELKDISPIKNSSINGLIEIGRGCPRGCKFCTVTLQKLRWYPLDMIEKELKANCKREEKSGTVHAEDVLLYGSKNVIPNKEKVLKMFKLVKKYYETFAWSHISFASALSDPRLVEEASQLIITKQKYIGVQIGIETGSPELAKRVMGAKAKPLNSENWQEIVLNGLGLLQDNNIFPYCTIILGLPGETEKDIIKTIELVDDIRTYRCLLVPLFFVSWGKLKNEKEFQFEEITDLQWDLLYKCFFHTTYWAKREGNNYFNHLWYGKFISPIYKLCTYRLEMLSKKKLKKRKK